jgi:hypothetical protein
MCVILMIRGHWNGDQPFAHPGDGSTSSVSNLCSNDP